MALVNHNKFGQSSEPERPAQKIAFRRYGTVERGKTANASEMIGYGFTLDWMRKWHEFLNSLSVVEHFLDQSAKPNQL